MISVPAYVIMVKLTHPRPPFGPGKYLFDPDNHALTDRDGPYNDIAYLSDYVAGCVAQELVREFFGCQTKIKRVVIEVPPK